MGCSIMKVGIDKLKLYAIVITVILAVLIIYSLIYPMIQNYCWNFGSSGTLKNIVNQIIITKNPIRIDGIEGKSLVCDVIK